MKQFVAYASKNKVAENPSELRISEHLIKIQLEAYIARNIIDNEGFYPILMEIDNTLLRAVDEFSK
jgi:carboxyl-terminal processing protease